MIVFALGGSSIDADEAAELENRIHVMRRDAHVNVVAAAGNGGGEPEFPGRFSSSFTVAGVDGSDGLCGFSARGNGVDLAAPACDIEQGDAHGDMYAMSGTSYAAPIVAGVLAAVRSYRPDLSADEAERLLVRTARPGPYPVVNAEAALRAIGLRWNLEAPDARRSTLEPGPPSAATEPSTSPMRYFGPVRVASLGDENPPLVRSRLAAPRLSATRRSRSWVFVQGYGCPKGAAVEASTPRARTRGSRHQAVIKSSKERTLLARCVSELEASKWVRLTIRTPRHSRARRSLPNAHTNLAQTESRDR